MWNKPAPKTLAEIPNLYETEHVSLKDKIIHLHFFIGGCDWFIAEASDDLLWGYAILNQDYDMAEWGYISFAELTAINIGGIEIDNDLYWKKRLARKVEKIRRGMGWHFQDKEDEIENSQRLHNRKRTLRSDGKGRKIQSGTTDHVPGQDWDAHPQPKRRIR